METATIVPNRRQFDRLMLKHNNNEPVVLEILRGREEKRQAKILLLTQSEQQFQPLLESLAAAGFTNVKVNVRLLVKFGGVDPVVNVLLKRQEKRSARDLKRKSCKDERFGTKLARQESRFARKEERRERKSLQGDKAEKREKRERKPEKEADPTVDWTIVEHLFLDGNNMLFVPSELRSLVLKRKSRAAERKLAELARIFALKHGLPKLTLLFDNTPLHEEGETFRLKSSRPEFATSDDELVVMAEAHQGERCLFVTSDRELRERLSAFGVGLMKPGRWFDAVAQILGEEYLEILGRQCE